MSGWVDRPFVALDCETTGVDCFADRIVQLAVATVDRAGNTVDSWCTIVDPGVDVPPEAAAIHGITTERCRDEGVAPDAALGAVAAWLYTVDIARTPLVMFNARYDWPLVLAEAERHDVDVPACAPILDPYLIDRMVDRFRRGRRKLGDMCAHYGVELAADRAHDALVDAVAAAQLMRAIAERHPALAERSLASLWLHQVHGHETWREGFVDYVRQNRDPQFDIPPGWPIPVRREVS